jgi:TrmH RNA methyltransferase
MTHADKPKPRFPRPAHSPRLDEDAPEGQAAPGSDPHAKLAKIAGLQAVTALFRRDPNRVIRLYFNDHMKKAVGDFCAEMAKMQRVYRLVDDSELQKISGTVLHGGVVAAALPRVVEDFDLDEARDWAKAGEPVLILDGVGNPHNLGAVARTLAYFGLKHLILSDHPGQAGLSDAAHRVAEGGLEYIEVYRASHLPQVLKQLREFYRVAGTSLRGHAIELASLPDDPRPLALVLGNEEDGLSTETLSACELAVIIRGAGRVQSLNVSATAAILIHAMAAKKPAGGVKKTPASPGPARTRSPRPQRDNDRT